MEWLKTQKIRNVPRWATACLVNGDFSGVEKEDADLIEEFENKLFSEGLRLICPIEGTDNEFCSCPAFGLACDTIDWTAEVIPKKYEIELKETLFANVRIEAHSRKEAEAKAIAYITGEHESLQSEGIKVERCKEVPREEVAG